MDPNSSSDLEEFQFDYDVDFSIMMDDGEDSFTEIFPSYQIAANLRTTEQPQREIGVLGSSSCGSNPHAVNQSLTEPAQGSSTPVMEHLETVQQDTPLFSFGSPVDLPEIMFSTMENLELSEAGNDDAELSAWMMRNLVPDTTARTSDTLVVCAALDTAAPFVGASSITGTIHPHVPAAMTELLGNLSNEVQISNTSSAQLQLDPVIFGGGESYSHHRNSGQSPAQSSNPSNMGPIISSSSLGVPMPRPLRAYTPTTVQLFQNESTWMTNTATMPSSQSQTPFHQTDFVMPQWSTPVTVSPNPFGNQLGQNMTMTSSLTRTNNTHQAPLYANSFLQPSVGSTGVLNGRSSSSRMTQQPGNRVPLMSGSTSAFSRLPLPSAWTQRHQIVPANRLQSNSLLRPSVPLRHQTFMDRLPTYNQVPRRTTAYSPQRRFSIAPTTQPWTRQFINQNYQAPPLPAVTYGQQPQTTTIPFSPRPRTEIPVTSGILDFQSYNPNSSSTPRSWQVSNNQQQQLNQVSRNQNLYGQWEQVLNPTANTVTPQQRSSIQLGSSVMNAYFKGQQSSAQGHEVTTLQQTNNTAASRGRGRGRGSGRGRGRGSGSGAGTGTGTGRGRERGRGRGRNNRIDQQQAQVSVWPPTMTRTALTAQLESLLAIANAAHPQQGSSLLINFEGPTRNTAQRIPREREAPTPAMEENSNSNSAAIGRVIWSQADNQHRIIPNAMYDSLYEGAGLAVDPHLRMFSFN